MLVQKFRFKPQDQVLLINCPEELILAFEKIDPKHLLHFDLKEIEEKIYDKLIIYASTRLEFEEYLNLYNFHLKPKLTLWLIYPKQFRDENTHDFTTTSWNLLHHQEFDLVAATSIMDKYTGLRFKNQISIREKYIGNGIEKNLLERHIDENNRLVRLPIKARMHLKSIPGALIYFHGLSFKVRKHYILWLLESIHDDHLFQQRTIVLTDRIIKSMNALMNIKS